MSPENKLRVFLIEDARKIRSILTDVLQQSGRIEVVGFAEAERDALNFLRENEWDVAIVDIRLREGNGLGVLAGLRNDERAYGKRYVFTNTADAALRKRSLALGAEGFFDKSCDLEVLVSHLQELAA